MPEQPTKTRETLRGRHLPEYGRLVFLLVSFLVLLFQSFSMKVWSDPVHWFTFGIDFPERFATSRLAYGFPLIVYGATRCLGPYHGFLVNLPILVLMLGVFVLFSRACAAGTPRRAWAVGLVAGSLLVLLNKAMLIELVSPYRDPAAFLFMLLAALFFVQHVEAERPRWIVPALGGLCLAYAVSCRETSGLVAGPLLFYALAARYRKWDGRFWTGLAWFGLFLFLGCLPWLVQNYLASGNPVVPAQSAKKVEQAASLIGMIPARRSDPHVLPTLAYLWNHYSAFGVAAAVLGLVTAVRERRATLCFLCAPAIVVYFLFYMLYVKIVPRYLLVIDFFMIPLMAQGAMEVLRAAAYLLRPRFREGTTNLVGGGLVVLVCIWMLATSPTHQRFLPRDARAFVEDVDRRLAPDTVVLCERPVEGLLLCFSHTRGRVLQYQGRRQVFQDATKWPAIRTLTEAGPVYLASLNEPVRRYVERAFDLDEERVLATGTYHLDEWFTASSVRFDRVVPWSARQVTADLYDEGGSGSTGPSAGFVELDLGHLSAYGREHLEVRYGEVLLDDSPRDNMNYYLVPSAEGRSIASRKPARLPLPERDVISVTSDGPLPRAVRGRRLPAGTPIVMNLRNEQLVRWHDRLSDPWLKRPNDRYPSLAGEGHLVLPTPGTNAWAVALQLSSPDLGKETCRVTLTDVDGTVLGSAAVASEGWTQVGAFLPGAPGAEGNRTVHVTATDVGEAPRRAWLRRIVLQPLESDDAGRRVRVGQSPGDLVHLGAGFYDAEQGPDGEFRWMGARATALFFLPAPERRAVFSVTYRDPHPATVAPAELVCTLNGEVLRTTSVAEVEGGSRWSAVVPASLLRRGVNKVTLDTRTWIPAEELRGNRDDRRLGVQVRELRLGRPSTPDSASDGSTAAAPG